MTGECLASPAPLGECGQWYDSQNRLSKAFREKREQLLKEGNVQEMYTFVYFSPVAQVGKHLLRQGIITSVRNFRIKHAGNETMSTRATSYILQRNVNRSVHISEVVKDPHGRLWPKRCDVVHFSERSPEAFDAVWEFLWPAPEHSFARQDLVKMVLSIKDLKCVPRLPPVKFPTEKDLPQQHEYDDHSSVGRKTHRIIHGWENVDVDWSKDLYHKEPCDASAPSSSAEQTTEAWRRPKKRTFNYLDEENGSEDMYR